MKRTLFRYLLTEISVPFALGMTVFSFVLLMGRFLRLVDLVVAKGVPLSDLARLLLYIFPSFCIITIPMALLLAILLAFGRLSADSEVTAMKASGVSLAGLLPPVMTMAFVTFIICTFLTIYALPWGNSSFRRLLVEIVQNRAALTIKERVFIDDFPGMVIYVDRYDQDRHQIHGVLIHDERNTKESSTIFAQSGLFYSDPMTRTLQLQLDNGEIHRSIGKNSYRHIVFDRYDLRITLNPISTESGRNEQDYSLDELFAGMKNQKLKPRERLDI
ncbi:MAG TPA: LptF/LptG family permease, partial [Geobacterales bacterium]|nr:LptF/LptG family permease [Geobacterales bacterium]